MPEKSECQNCPLCGNANSELLFLNEDYVSNEKFGIRKCGQCGLVRTSQNNLTDLKNYYPATYYGEGDSAFHPFLENLISWFRSGRARMVERAVGHPGNILDIGCGRARMLSLLAKRGWNCFGTELSETSAKRAMQQEGIKITVTNDIRDCHFNDNFFDVISLWHVLEHVDDLDATFREIKRILKPEGLLVIEVPNFSSLQSVLGKGRWFHLDAPRHLYHFDPHSLHNLLKRYGFNLNDFQTSSFEMGPYGILQTVFNRFTGSQNFFYTVLMRKKALKPSNSTELRNLLTHSLLLPIFIPMSFVFEVVANLLNRGAVLRTVARKV